MKSLNRQTFTFSSFFNLLHNSDITISRIIWIKKATLKNKLANVIMHKTSAIHGKTFTNACNVNVDSMVTNSSNITFTSDEQAGFQYKIQFPKKQ